MTQWSGSEIEQIAPNLVASIGRPDFYKSVSSLVRLDISAPAVSAYLLARGKSPKMRFQSMPAVSVRRRSVPMNAFETWAYALDPVYNAFISGADGGAFSLAELLPENFEETDFFQEFYSKAYASDEISLFTRLSPDKAIAFYFVREVGAVPFTHADLDYVRTLAPTLLQCAILHEQLLQADVPPARFSAQWRLALDTFGTSVLTLREQQIAQLTLLGMTAEDAAQQFDLATGTVKNHRKAIYRKLRITSLGELMALFLQTAAYANGHDDPLELCPAQSLGMAPFSNRLGR
ncbi:MAG: helix-turn-helix transcriptional regulator [Pseudomonadota bacterium]